MGDQPQSDSFIARAIAISVFVLVGIGVGVGAAGDADAASAMPWYIYVALVQSGLAALVLGVMWLRRRFASSPVDPLLSSPAPELAAGAPRTSGEPTAPQPQPQPRFTPLVCPSCGANVPLAAGELTCPSCGKAVPEPPGMSLALSLRSDAERELELAARRLRLARAYSSSAAGQLLSILAWADAFFSVAAVGYCFGVGFLPKLVVPFVAAGGITVCFAGLELNRYLGKVRRLLPGLPALRELPAEPVACSHCGAPIAFAAGALAVVCPYCGGEQVRAAMARTLAAADEQSAAALVRSTADRLARDRREAADDFVFGAMLAAVIAVLVGAFAAFGTTPDP